MIDKSKIPVKLEGLIELPQSMANFKDWFHSGNGVFTIVGNRADHVVANVMMTAMSFMWQKIGDYFLFADAATMFMDDVDPFYHKRVVGLLQPDVLREENDVQVFQRVMRYRVLSRPKKFTFIALNKPWSAKYGIPSEMTEGIMVMV